VRQHGTVPGGERIEGVVQPLDREGVGERLRPCAVTEQAERIVQRLDGDVRLSQLVGEPVMAIAVELQPVCLEVRLCTIFAA